MTSYDAEALEGAATFFEDVATGADPAPLAFALAIRRAALKASLLEATLSDLNALCNDFGVRGGENRIAGLRRVLSEAKRSRINALHEAASICGSLRRKAQPATDDWADATVDCADAIREAIPT